jgi:hypothetical protein
MALKLQAQALETELAEIVKKQATQQAKIQQQRGNAGDRAPE